MTGAATSMRGAFGRRSKRVERTPTSAMEGSMSVGFEPVRLLELELADFRLRSSGRVEDARLPVRPGTRSPARHAARRPGHRLARLRDRPRSPRRARPAEIGAAIDAHVMDDCLAHTSPGSESPAGSLGVPRCVRERLEFSARAPFASIVIATRERPDGLAATLDTVLALEYPRFEIIVVDNANTTDPDTESSRAPLRRRPEPLLRSRAAPRTRGGAQPRAHQGTRRDRGLHERRRRRRLPVAGRARARLRVRRRRCVCHRPDPPDGARDAGPVLARELDSVQQGLRRRRLDLRAPRRNGMPAVTATSRGVSPMAYPELRQTVQGRSSARRDGRSACSRRSGR
jgi:hypothetical protein